jgi:hypothetical protein
LQLKVKDIVAKVNVLALAIMQLCRIRKGESFCPSEVVRWIYPQDWQYFIEDVRKEMMNLYRQGQIIVIQNGIPVDPLKMPKGPVRIIAKN